MTLEPARRGKRLLLLRGRLAVRRLAPLTTYVAVDSDQVVGFSNLRDDGYVDHLFAFAAGRTADEDADACTIDSLEADFAASGGTLTDLLVAYARSDAFRYRRRDP